jgi:hypothetical protein
VEIKMGEPNGTGGIRPGSNVLAGRHMAANIRRTIPAEYMRIGKPFGECLYKIREIIDPLNGNYVSSIKKFAEMIHYSVSEAPQDISASGDITDFKNNVFQEADMKRIHVEIQSNPNKKGVEGVGDGSSTIHYAERISAPGVFGFVSTKDFQQPEKKGRISGEGVLLTPEGILYFIYNHYDDHAYRDFGTARRSFSISSYIPAKGVVNPDDLPKLVESILPSKIILKKAFSINYEDPQAKFVKFFG